MPYARVLDFRLPSIPAVGPRFALEQESMGSLGVVAPATARLSDPQPAPIAYEVLVVDDDPFILSTVREILTDEGIQVATATNGEEALQVLGRTKPRVVLLDMRMPVMDGWTFAKEVRRRGEHIPILVMTAAQDARRWAAEINADGYLSKPFDITDLLDSVAQYRPAS